VAVDEPSRARAKSRRYLRGSCPAHSHARNRAWRWVNFKEILHNWGLPAEQADCRAYAGLDSAQ
jgi:hypothetical protein